MPPSRSRRNWIIAIILLLLVLLILLLARCTRKPLQPASESSPPSSATTPAAEPTSNPVQASPAPAAPPDEVLTPATITAPAAVPAGSIFSVTWTGPNNAKDFITVVHRDARDGSIEQYREVHEGSELQFTAPIDPGDWELRYMTDRSRTVLGRTPLQVTAIAATMTAPTEVILGAEIEVSWTGPKNQGDYITLVPRETPDGQYGNYTDVAAGSPLKVRVPVIAGPAELRYMTGQGNRVIGRRAVTIMMPDVSLSAATQVDAGAKVEVTWNGPNNSGDYVTIVQADQPEGSYGNYTETSRGSPLTVLVPVMPGDAELRYMSGQGGKVLARRALVIRPVSATLSAPDEVKAGAAIEITWTGPAYDGDYVTVVARDTPDGQYGPYTNASQGSPLSVKAPATPGDAELRYMTGQGGKVIARRPIRIVP